MWILKNKLQIYSQNLYLEVLLKTLDKCWTWCYGVGIDVKEGQYGQCWIWCYGVGIDVKEGQYDHHYKWIIQYGSIQVTDRGVNKTGFIKRGIGNEKCPNKSMLFILEDIMKKFTMELCLVLCLCLYHLLKQ
jgi:hypothetical protein